MNNYAFYFTIVVMFNYFFLNALAGNNYYIISIERNPNDEEYDKASERLQNAVDKLVNDRMNDIFDIIVKNKKTYKLANGIMDEKLKELSLIRQLGKRNENEIPENDNIITKFLFVNKNRIQKLPNVKRSLKDEEEEDKTIEYIPLESSLVSHICPVLNYYVIKAYLSDYVVNEVCCLPNIIGCRKAIATKEQRSIDYDDTNETTSSSKYYNKEAILKETKWKDLEVQENHFNFTLEHSHLSLISQGKYSKKSGVLYDNNYYYPASAGKGIDVYVIDGGLDTTIHEEDFDTYEGTSDERTIACAGKVVDGQFISVSNMTECRIGGEGDVRHGTLVSIAALGKVNGVAKKANLHMIATEYEDFDDLVALDYIKQHAEPHKSVVNISRGCYNNENCYSPVIQNKITELINNGIIIIVAAGNSYGYNCIDQIYTSCNGVIPVAAINNRGIKDPSNMEEVYERAVYSSYGECVLLFAPGTIRVSDSSSNEVLRTDSGTSYASPIVTGVAATLMAENPNIQYTFNLMKGKLIDLSLKDVIRNLDISTPNRLINNGKRLIYHQPGCEDDSCKN
eukprot:jgi/Orpsp1_1/1184634/evm.model.c7180000090319.1